jgi:N-acetyl-anhydromuramyl-L-alanine amidase AmpD
MQIHDRIGKYLAQGRSWYTRNVNTIKVFSVHHDAIPHDNRSADEVMKQILGIHNGKNGWPGMSYHYYIHRDGSIYQVNKHEWVTWIDGINWDAIGIVVNGYFHPPYNNDPATAQGTPQLKALRFLLDKLSTQHPEFPASQKDVYAHRERASTACPGDKLFGYVKDYRDKLGKVPWGQYVVTPPTPPTPPQPQIPEVIENQEQKVKINNEVKSLKDWGSTVESLKNQVDSANGNVTRLQEKINKAKAELA